MRTLYERWISNWETRLTTRDTNRIVRPFEWGVEWTRSWPNVNGNYPASAEEHERFLHELNREIVRESESFFGYRMPSDFRLERRRVERFATGNNQEQHHSREEYADFLRFTSPVPTPYPENNLANARWFAPRRRAKETARKRRAVVVLPHWNADGVAYNSICRMLSYFGVASLRMSLPYHDIRRPAGVLRADYAVSSNVARTIDAARQAIIDLRCCLDWLQMQGYEDFGVLGTSLGSCYAFIASAHDERLRVNVFNHASTYFADVVWEGQSTRHIRAGVEPAITLESLRQAWAAISPPCYMDMFASKPKKTLVIYAKYDRTFPREFSEQVVAELTRRGVDFKAVCLPCGHYTVGEVPFKFVDGYHIMKYLVQG
jgi:dienelactone hydrolase